MTGRGVAIFRLFVSTAVLINNVGGSIPINLTNYYVTKLANPLEGYLKNNTVFTEVNMCTNFKKEKGEDLRFFIMCHQSNGTVPLLIDGQLGEDPVINGSYQLNKLKYYYALADAITKPFITFEIPDSNCVHRASLTFYVNKTFNASLPQSWKLRSGSNDSEMTDHEYHSNSSQNGSHVTVNLTLIEEVCRKYFRIKLVSCKNCSHFIYLVSEVQLFSNPKDTVTAPSSTPGLEPGSIWPEYALLQKYLLYFVIGGGLILLCLLLILILSIICAAYCTLNRCLRMRTKMITEKRAISEQTEEGNERYSRFTVTDAVVADHEREQSFSRVSAFSKTTYYSKGPSVSDVPSPDHADIVDDPNYAVASGGRQVDDHKDIDYDSLHSLDSSLRHIPTVDGYAYLNNDEDCHDKEPTYANDVIISEMLAKRSQLQAVPAVTDTAFGDPEYAEIELNTVTSRTRHPYAIVDPNPSDEDSS